MERRKYHGIDGLRAIACVGIAMMHIQANTSYEIKGFVYERLIPSFTDFVYLFMAISAFGMCCGYYEKVLNGKVNWTDFYKKRYMKIVPFFSVLIAIDLVMSFSLTSLFEGLTEVTLLHGFIPQELTVIGVGWYLGTVFVFYLIFSFFCVLIESKSRAWFAFIISVALHYICANHFFLNRHNILFSLCYFLLGGLIYLYRDSLIRIRKYNMLIVIISLLGYYFFGSGTITILLVTYSLLAFAISIENGYYKTISFISGISMEIYLSHMVVFRLIEKLHLTTICGNGWLQYGITTILVIIGVICFSYVLKKIINVVGKRIF